MELAPNLAIKNSGPLLNVTRLDRGEITPFVSSSRLPKVQPSKQKKIREFAGDFTITLGKIPIC